MPRGEWWSILSQPLRQTSKEATILLYSPAQDHHLQKMTRLELADRVFSIYSEQAARREARMPGAQAALEAYS